MHIKKRDNLLKLSENERADYLVRYCTDFEKVWGLIVDEDRWITFVDSENDHIFPIWPHQDLAEYCCFSEHRQMNAKPHSIELDIFLKTCIPDMETNTILFGLFYDNHRKGLAVSAEKLKMLIEEEITI